MINNLVAAMALVVAVEADTADTALYDAAVAIADFSTRTCPSTSVTGVWSSTLVVGDHDRDSNTTDEDMIFKVAKLRINASN